jgi:cell division septal protein FtsQ
MKQQIKNFFLTNYFLRKARNFLRLTIVPIIVKTLLVVIALIFFIFVFLKIFKPTQLEKIYKKSNFYFFHYLNLDNQEFAQINIDGNIHVKKEQIVEIIRKAQIEVGKEISGDYQPLTHKIIEQIKAELPWVHQVTIARNMPNILNILIVEYAPIAIWQNEGEKYFSDKEGNLVPFEDLEEFKDMVLLSGLGANTNAKSLFNIFTADENLSKNVYSATWVSNRRWDIRFENGLLIKLPENNISDAWRRLIKIYNMPGSIVGLKVIDLRVMDKVYLEYDDSVIKELKSL